VVFSISSAFAGTYWFIAIASPSFVVHFVLLPQLSSGYDVATVILTFFADLQFKFCIRVPLPGKICSTY
jgi:hypothetical protein